MHYFDVLLLLCFHADQDDILQENDFDNDDILEDFEVIIFFNTEWNVGISVNKIQLQFMYNIK